MFGEVIDSSDDACLQVIVDCLIKSKDEAFQEEARILLLNLGRGNPRFQVLRVRVRLGGDHGATCFKPLRL